MAIGAIWAEIWNEAIWDMAIWSQVAVEPATEVVQIVIASQRMSDILVLSEDDDEAVLYPERSDGILVVKE